jgi:hypothetical protein
MHMDDLWFYINCVHLLVYVGDYRADLLPMSSEVLIAVTTETAVFWDVLVSSLANMFCMGSQTPLDSSEI